MNTERKNVRITDFDLNRARIELDKFLNRYKVKGEGVAYTHTAFGAPWGKFNVPDSDMEKMYELYCNALGNDMHLTEKPKTVGPLIIDVDIKVSDSDFTIMSSSDFTDRMFPDQNLTKRVYSEDDIKYVVGNINMLIRNYYKIDFNKMKAFVFEKDKPTYKKDNKEYKDGFHIMYPFLPVQMNMRYILLNELCEKIKAENGFMHLKHTNDVDDIIDMSVIENNGWMMYGSRKDGGPIYKLTHIYKYTYEEEDLIKYRHRELVKILSNRRYKDEDGMHFRETISLSDIREKMSKLSKIKNREPERDLRNINDEIEIEQNNADEVETNYDEMEDVEDDNKRHKLTYEEEMIRQEVLRNLKTASRNRPNDKSDVEIAKKLAMILSEKRAEKYGLWIEVGWALHNVSTLLLDTWKEFSKKCAKKYNERECERVWNQARNSGLSISSLHWWAKTDNPDKYKDVLSDSVSDLLAEAVSGTPYDVASVVYQIYKPYYRCTSLQHATWYEFQGDLWTEVENGYTLDLRLSEELVQEFARYANGAWQDIQTAKGRDQDYYTKRAHNITNLIMKLKKPAFKREVMRECAHKFIEPTFEEKLDSHKNLIGFTNGVYDLEQMCFRRGTPDDWVSLCVGYPYKEYEMDSIEIQEVEDFFNKVQTETDMREYVKTLLASYIDGHTKQQKFIIWTGSGCHARGTKIMMSNGSVKNVEDIQVGDKLMGDDSTPRSVKELFRGHAKMYKVTPMKGDPYIVNDNHILCLKATNISRIVWIEKESQYKVSWQEKNDFGIPVLKAMNFKVDDYKTKNEAHDEAIKFKNDLMTNNNKVIKKGDIIEMSVMDYMENIGEIGAHNYSGYKVGVTFEEKKLKIDPYVFGYWLCDSDNKRSTNMSKIGCDILPDDLRYYGVINDKHIPDDFKFNSRDNQLELLAGIIDSEHYSHKDSNQYNLALKSEKMIDDVIFLCRSLGFASYKNGHIVQIYGSGIEKIPIRFKGKKTSQTIKVKDALLNSFKVEYVNNDNYFGFELDGNHRYLMNDFTVTHNSNGKSSLVEFFQLAMGEYCGTFPNTVLTRKRGNSSGASPELADKRGKRFVVIQEPESDDQINVGFMKELTGRDIIYARPLFKDPIEFRPQFKLLLTCNKLPWIPSGDGGTWRRLRVTPFESEFVDEPTLPHQFPKDDELYEKFERNKGALLWYLINKYYKKFMDNGLKEPEKVLMHTKNYKKQSDIFLEFIEDELEVTKSNGDFETMDTIYSTFKQWYKDAHSGSTSLSKKEFREYLEKNRYNVDKKYLYGVRFRIDERAPKRELDD